ncbi:hypothetical protein NECAME_05520 [Necator americanus]|uniref:Uncharacterized protein n=1 Tax=Necator americanus TaxID=51031 RepID=W2SGF1_NECAM|nr:hypothetical protein NECAME_05520 [Necator americanus]ETN68675.1 hypothetical protein NECAME_05520 [Necator americanus]
MPVHCTSLWLFYALKKVVLVTTIAGEVSGLSQLDAKQSGKMGSLAITYYVLTTVIAVIKTITAKKKCELEARQIEHSSVKLKQYTGIILVLTIHPGDPSIKQDLGEGTEGKKVSTLDTLLDLLR